jgi:hypothetical protein
MPATTSATAAAEILRAVVPIGATGVRTMTSLPVEEPLW